jgi:hypothetical protein
MSLFQKGQAKIPGSGRAKGVKNRLSHAFITALVEDFEKHGAEAIRICRVEKPNEYLRVVASLMPKELEITDNRLHDITDDELIAYIEYVQRQLAGRIERIEDGTSEASH